MKIEGGPFQTTDWSKVPPTKHPGESGTATWRTVEVGNLRMRQVDYSAGYRADHWCERGHVLLVLEGELITELRDGRQFVMGPGHSYLAVGASCLVTVDFHPPAGLATYDSGLNLAYSDGSGAVSPNANRNLRGFAN